MCRMALKSLKSKMQVMRSCEPSAGCIAMAFSSVYTATRSFSSVVKSPPLSQRSTYTARPSTSCPATNTGLNGKYGAMSASLISSGRNASSTKRQCSVSTSSLYAAATFHCRARRYRSRHRWSQNAASSSVSPRSCSRVRSAISLASWNRVSTSYGSRGSSTRKTLSAWKYPVPKPRSTTITPSSLSSTTAPAPRLVSHTLLAAPPWGSTTLPPRARSDRFFSTCTE
mmetsp:Transcript_5614/g.20095  ORF Transcript_5614/g.20095 Transcript_5614/m.20095 type:complete len:227 (-) Transcript_5614:319-999(-)